MSHRTGHRIAECAQLRAHKKQIIPTHNFKHQSQKKLKHYILSLWKKTAQWLKSTKRELMRCKNRRYLSITREWNKGTIYVAKKSRAELNSQVQSAQLDPTFTLKLNTRSLGNSTATKSNLLILSYTIRDLLALVLIIINLEENYLIELKIINYDEWMYLFLMWLKTANLTKWRKKAKLYYPIVFLSHNGTQIRHSVTLNMN